MSHAFSIVSQNALGYGLTDRRCFPYSGVSGRSVTVSRCSLNGNDRLYTKLRTDFSKCISGGTSFVCRASSSGRRRNHVFSRQKHGFPGRNRENEERENYENLDESEMFSSKKGPLLPLSSSPKFQSTASPGPREKEIVELFRKVQAQLRERSAAKEEKRFEASQGKGNETETVNSLLKLLRKHSVEQGKKSSSNNPIDLSVDRPEESGPYDEDKRSSSIGTSKKSSFFDSNNSSSEETSPPALNRPASNFRRKSPVPHVKYQSIITSEDIDNSEVSTNAVSLLNSDGKIHASSKWLPPEPQHVPDPGFQADVQDVLDVSEDGALYIDDPGADVNDSADEQREHEDLSALKITELRAIAKARGMKGFSKMKKAELLELLDSMSSV